METSHLTKKAMNALGIQQYIYKYISNMQYQTIMTFSKFHVLWNWTYGTVSYIACTTHQGGGVKLALYIDCTMKG
jgi:hypothetical protein